MFKKIVSNLPFSPALVGQLGAYAKKLRKEKSNRRLALVFIILALIVQSLAIFEPPEPANASNDTDSILHFQDQSSDKHISKIITATNYTQGYVDAESVVAKGSDQISYTLTIENEGEKTVDIIPELFVSDILEYADFVDNGGGTIKKASGTLFWPKISLEPNTQQTRTFVIRLLSNVPATARGINNTKSYDCLITANFGNTVNISVDCPNVKVVEQVVSQLPQAESIVNIIFANLVLITGAYYYARSRQLEKEIRLVRKDVSTGTIY